MLYSLLSQETPWKQAGINGNEKNGGVGDPESDAFQEYGGRTAAIFIRQLLLNLIRDSIFQAKERAVFKVPRRTRTIYRQFAAD